MMCGSFGSHRSMSARYEPRARRVGPAPSSASADLSVTDRSGGEAEGEGGGEGGADPEWQISE